LFYSLEYTTVLTAEQQSSFPMGFEETFRTSLFNVVAIMTSSGYPVLRDLYSRRREYKDILSAKLKISPLVRIFGLRAVS